MLCHKYLTQIKVAPLEVHHFNQPGEPVDLTDDMVHHTHEPEAQTACPSIVLRDELSKPNQVRCNFLQAQGVDNF